MKASSCLVNTLLLTKAVGIVAWISQPTPNLMGHVELFSKESDSNDCRPEILDHGSSRRQLLSSGLAAASCAVGCGFPSALPAQAIEVMSTASVCDPTVSVWQREKRIIYLLGTAHISETSAQLAGNLVQDAHPDAVFVELDLKRVGGSKRALQSSQNEEATTTASIEPFDGKPTSRLMVSPVLSDPILSSSSQMVAASGEDSQVVPSKKSSGGPLVALGAAAVGKGIKSMYSKLGEQGFNPGEEFTMAIKEGQKIGATVVLGDQDVDVTLRRLSQALAQTDLNKIMNPDSEFEASMKSLMASQQVSTKTNPSDMSTEDLKYFVEAMKSKDNVKNIMGQLKLLAPALYQVMLTERDAYMSAGLNALNEFSVIVAVMGLAHVDGVENNLKSQGWKPVPLTCPKLV